MQTIWINEHQLTNALQRNQAFWEGTLEGYPLMWVSAPEGHDVPPIPEPATDEEMWTNLDYAMARAERDCARRYYAADTLPFYDPWFGPDQFAAWLGAEMTIRPRENTSWSKPLIETWETFPAFRIDPDNRWWKLYLAGLDASLEAGAGKWVTAFPDLHAGADALSALRGTEQLSIDLLMEPGAVKRAMRELTRLWKEVVDLVTRKIMPGGQGTTNWTGGWSREQFVCFGHNDFTCMISPEMFDAFFLEDTRECVEHVTHCIYHLDGPGATRHLPAILAIEKLHTVQWVHGDGNPTPIHQLDMLRDIQQHGKAVQIWYNLNHTTNLVNVFDELNAVCRALDPGKLFIGVDMSTIEGADAVVKHIRKVCDEARPTVA